MKDNTGEGIFSEERFNEIVGGMDQDNWILANAVRLVYYAGFHKNEIREIKIGNIQMEGAVVSEVTPFLPETTRAYSTMPIFVNDESKKIIENHIKRLTDNGYYVSIDGATFP